MKRMLSPKNALSLVFSLGLVAMLGAGIYGLQSENPAVAAESASVAEKPLGHMVFFTLKEKTPEGARNSSSSARLIWSIIRARSIFRWEPWRRTSIAR